MRVHDLDEPLTPRKARLLGFFKAYSIMDKDAVWRFLSKRRKRDWALF
ncbi:hypothetical protein B4099_3367 [Heyndrickxia coagulans]|uniref:Uncharacterized protein n=1 Tax=Heyndrickxia coagulans TaxID=1398 RepID=A0A150K827_HEYCO|nr:hypothetical protein B4099_3367 [Heyndrickxia coagulans]